MGRLSGLALSLRSKGGDDGYVFLTAPSTRNAFSVVFYGWRVSGGSVAWPLLGLRYRRPVMAMLDDAPLTSNGGQWLKLFVKSKQKGT